MSDNVKMPYVKIYIIGSDKPEYWPYPEAQEYSNYKFSKKNIIWLSDDELKLLEKE